MELLTQTSRLPGAFLSRCWDREGSRCLVKLSPLTQRPVTAHTRILRSAPGKLSRPRGAPMSHEAKADTETEDKSRMWKQNIYTFSPCHVPELNV